MRERYGEYDKALELFNKAIEFSPENALVRYHRAKILIATKKYTVSVGVSVPVSLGLSRLIDGCRGVYAVFLRRTHHLTPP